ncbi:MAG: hypothetical protein ACJ75Z_09205 [Solirubrobacterales bacterium]
MKSASRTLVKSQPELWEMIDQPDRMQGLMSGLLGRAAKVTVSKRKPESILRWEAAGEDEQAWINVKLAEKGWGTHVEVSASKAQEPVSLEGWLDAVLEELATPEKRPFGGKKRDEMPVAEVVKTQDSPAKPEPVKEKPAGTATTAPPPRKKRRFLGFEF